MSSYFLIAGESSGDIHGARLIQALRKKDPQAEFHGFGGDLMQAAGMNLKQHFRDISYMGFKEVLLHLRTISKAIKQCKQEILKLKPDVIILIDYPGFNLRIADFAKKRNFKIAYYISPQIWAWKENRVHKIKRNVDRMISILPFEKDFYARYDFAIDYVGHPLLDHINAFTPDADFIEKHQLLGKQLVAMLPGSRKQEIKKILPVFREVCKKNPDQYFLVAATSSVDKSLYASIEKQSNAVLIYDDSYNILYHAQSGIIKSGTSTLEAALFGLPSMVVYKTTATTYYLSKWMIKVDYISLVNLIMGKQIVKEWIQQDCSPDVIDSELKLLQTESYRSKMTHDYNVLREKLGNKGASDKAADVVSSLIHDI
jgi:lipid-A-disaccharide synthase